MGLFSVLLLLFSSLWYLPLCYTCGGWKVNQLLFFQYYLLVTLLAFSFMESAVVAKLGFEILPLVLGRWWRSFLYFRMPLWQSLFSIPCPVWHGHASVLQAKAKWCPRYNEVLNWGEKTVSLIQINNQTKKRMPTKLFFLDFRILSDFPSSIFRVVFELLSSCWTHLFYCSVGPCNFIAQLSRLLNKVQKQTFLAKAKVLRQTVVI